MTKPDMLAELADVVRLCDVASAMLPSAEGNEAIKLAETSATNWVIAHHAELEAMARDKRADLADDDVWRALEVWDNCVMNAKYGRFAAMREAIKSAMRAENGHD